MSEENSYPPMFSPSPPSHPHLFPSHGLPHYPLPPRCFSSSHHLTPPSPRSSYFPSPTCVDFCFHLGCMYGPGIRNMFTCSEIRNTSSTCVSFVCINLYAHILAGPAESMNRCKWLESSQPPESLGLWDLHGFPPRVPLANHTLEPY